MRGKSIVVTLVPIASSRPIGKAEAADCISPIRERAEDDDDDDHDSKQKTVFLTIDDKQHEGALGDAQQKS